MAGELLGEHVNPRHLQGDQAFEEVLHNRAMAKTAIVQAETDRKLRRALLRRYSGTNFPLRVGQSCFYWRDARQPDLVKIRWLGPGRVLLREDDENGIPTMYWIGHKTQLLRCAPHHVRADFRGGVENALEEVEKAKVEVRELKSRGVTRYHDLNILNKASIDDVNTDEEFLEDDDEVQEPPRQRPRLTFDADFPSTGLMDNDCDYSPTTVGAPETCSCMILVVWVVDCGMSQTCLFLTLMMNVQNLLPWNWILLSVNLLSMPCWMRPSAANTVVNTPTARQPSQPPPAPMVLDSITASYYEPVHVEDFASRRRRVDQQETMSVFGPARHRLPTHAPGPYAPAGWFRPTFWCRSTSATRQQRVGSAHGSSPYGDGFGS